MLASGSALLTLSVTVAACGTPASKVVIAGRASTRMTTPPETGPTKAALSAYRAMWTDFVAASRTSDYQSPLLPQHAAGSALSILVRGLARNQQLGIVTKGQPIMDPEVTMLSPPDSPTQATISDCVNATHWLEYGTSGSLVNDIPGGRHATTAVVTSIGGVWTVTGLAIQASGTC